MNDIVKEFEDKGGYSSTFMENFKGRSGENILVPPTPCTCHPASTIMNTGQAYYVCTLLTSYNFIYNYFGICL